MTPARPALAPILFPDMPADVRHLLPRTLDELLSHRLDAIKAVARLSDGSRRDLKFACRYALRANRLNARIAQVAK
ncbi:hypothetical protein [Paracoccus sp. SY]|uniref:hypothetical protein n=1 Tax=Paracoccus sp. SY TaxID=1330255 RepID=UPI000CD15E16|nr:hypothetical protein [Paracoccus sp. SY]